MAKIVVLTIMLIMGLSSAEAATDATAFTLSQLDVPHTDDATIRTVSENYVFTPDLNFKGSGTVTGEITANGGGGQFSQGTTFNAGRNGDLYGMSLYSNEFNWKGATKLRTSCEGAVTTAVRGQVPGEWNYPSEGTATYTPGTGDGVESIASGLTMANAGSSKYGLTLQGGFKTVTNAVTNKIRPRPIEYKVSLDIDPVESVQPIDLLNQNSKLDFQINDNGFAYYGYDFQRDLRIGDVDCKSEMTLVHLGN